VIDHLVYGTPDLDGSVAELNARFGITLSPGGRHLGLGTRNYLADLGGRAFLEVIGRDPDQPEPEAPRPFGLDRLIEPRLLTWAVAVNDLDQVVSTAAGQGHDLGPITPMSRDRPDGQRLNWRLAVPPAGENLDGLVPFLIDWADCPHPSDSAAVGLRLTSFSGFHPDVARARDRLAVIGAAQHLTLWPADVPGLLALLDTPAGRRELS
jgi:hypothetical protein